MKKALIFGIGGQAGSYLVDFLLKKDYIIYGTYFNSKPYVPTGHTLGRYYTMKCDVTWPHEVSKIIKSCAPDEVYNMTSLMFAPASWKLPSSYLLTNAIAVSDMLASYSTVFPQGRFFQAGSAEVFDRQYPQNELTTIRPRNPYGISKAAAQELVRVYREEKGFFACTGIFFNMESPRRDPFFFTRKVSIGMRELVEKKIEVLKLGNLQAKRDWGLTEEYVEAAWLMLQANIPTDYVIGTGLGRSCLEYVKEAVYAAGVGMDKIEFDKTISMNEDKSVCDPTKIKEELNWQAKTKFPAIVRYLVTEELKNVKPV
jgi:GDPmannose 4,6-dehydratase